MKRYILKTQVNLDTAEQTLLIPLLGRGKQFELESIEKLSKAIQLRQYFQMYLSKQQI